MWANQSFQSSGEPLLHWLMSPVSASPPCSQSDIKSANPFINNWVLKQSRPLSTFKDTLSPCQGRLPRRKYMNIWPRASKSSRRLCSKREDRSYIMFAVIKAERVSKPSNPFRNPSALERLCLLILCTSKAGIVILDQTKKKKKNNVYFFGWLCHWQANPKWKEQILN